jgi:hypothetical protein
MDSNKKNIIIGTIVVLIIALSTALVFFVISRTSQTDDEQLVENNDTTAIETNEPIPQFRDEWPISDELTLRDSYNFQSSEDVCEIFNTLEIEEIFQTNIESVLEWNFGDEKRCAYYSDSATSSGIVITIHEYSETDDEWQRYVESRLSDYPEDLITNEYATQNNLKDQEDSSWGIIENNNTIALIYRSQSSRHAHFSADTIQFHVSISDEFIETENLEEFMIQAHSQLLV